MLDTLVVRTVMPLVALVFGTSALGSEIEDGTAVYLLAKPIARWQIVLAKMLVAAGLTAVLIVPSIVITGAPARAGATVDRDVGYAVACPRRRERVRGGVRDPQRVHVASLLFGLAYVLIWEGVLSGLLEGHEVPVDPPGDPRVAAAPRCQRAGGTPLRPP